MKHTVVIFNKNNAKVVNTTRLTFLKNMPNVSINPDLTVVSGVPTHYWKLDNGKVIAMNLSERLTRLADIQINGIDNSFIFDAPKYKEYINKNKLCLRDTDQGTAIDIKINYPIEIIGRFIYLTLGIIIMTIIGA